MSSIGPAHCAMPRWMLPNILKYYVLVHDNSSMIDETTVTELFTSMCTTYGEENCYLLCLNSSENSELPDLWENFIAEKYRGIKKGLDLARRRLLSKPDVIFEDMTPSTSTVSCSEVLTETFGEDPGKGGDIAVENTLVYHGRCLDSDDRKRIRLFIEEMLNNAVSPFITRQMRSLNEQIIARRGISKSLATGVRKWFGSASAPQLATSSSVTYSLESQEMQSRRLADMCFVFGLYSYAYQIYQSIRKEFANQASIYEAGALEMTAISEFMMNPQLLGKYYHYHYMIEAINYYANVCMRPLLALRAVYMCTSIMSSMKLHRESAYQLLKVTSKDEELYSGILLAKAALCFQEARSSRKAAFYYVSAGSRLFKAGEKKLAIECYRRALPVYHGKSWELAEGHILFNLSTACPPSEESVGWCASLLRQNSKLDGEMQRLYLKHLLLLLNKLQSPPDFPADLKIFLLGENKFRIIYGEKPETPDLEEIISTSNNVLNDAVPSPNELWTNLEQAAFCQLFGSSRVFKPTPYMSDAFTDNRKVHSTPPFERFRVQLELKNPFAFSLLLRNVRLGIEGDSVLFQQNVIDEVVLDVSDSWKRIELYIIPSHDMQKIRVKFLICDIVMDDVAVTRYFPLIVGRPQSKMNTRKQVSPTVDNRLEVNVSNNRWPLVDVQVQRTQNIGAFCGQVSISNCDITNIGSVSLTSFCVTTDHPECVMVIDESTGVSDDRWQYTTVGSYVNEWSVGIYSYGTPGIPVGDRKKLKLALRAPLTPEKNFRISLLFYFVGENGMTRLHRQVLVMNTRPLLESSFRLIDGAMGLCLLSMRNLISAADSVLVRVSILRIRSIVIEPKSGRSTNYSPGEITDSSLPNISIRPIKNRLVALECDQSDVLGFIVSAYPTTDCSSEVWMDETLRRVLLCFGVLWQANIVNSDGTIGVVSGEAYVDSPYPTGYGILGCARNDPPSLIYPISQINELIKDSETNTLPSEIKMDEFNVATDALLCSVRCPQETIYHDFRSSTFCRIPLHVCIRNCDRARRTCDVVLRFHNTPKILPFANDLSGGRNAALMTNDDLSQNSVMPSIITESSSDTLLMIANRSISHAHVPFGATHNFNICISVAYSSVYKIASFEAVGRFEGSDVDVPIMVPEVYATVIDKRVEI
ncbi:hypothetical protein AB6A40_006135 [Gnathostoma spinigerum]|uniref:TPPC8 first Ig-like domain-containing protein n=1 Tax=Gnathostoma spinigerum TaxID=75299 RepID=A0ABD6EJK0_9BILA